MSKYAVILLSILLFVTACSQEPTLKSKFKDDFYIGSAVNRLQIKGQDPSAMAIVKQQFNTITAENDLKWEKIHPEPDRYNFVPADQFVEFGEQNNMAVIGHVLVWHSQTPAHVFQDENGDPVDRETLLSRMKDHISTVVGRYKGRIHGWDVVNEAIQDGTGELRKSKWLRIIGEDYIQKAFEFAREADPDVELYYNDYSMCDSAKITGTVKLVKSLLEKGVKVDGIGMQGHWTLDYPTHEQLESALKAYSELGVKIVITEMDIDVLPSAWNYFGADINTRFKLKEELNPYKEALPDSMQQKLADRYVKLFNHFLSYKDNITRVTFWGITDGNSWKNNFPVRGRTNYPLLWDRQYQPKPAYYAVMNIK